METATDRRRFLAAVLTGAVAGLAGCSQSSPSTGQGTTATTDATPSETGTATEAETAAETTNGGSFPESVGLETLATGFDVPLDVAFAPDADRRYVADQRGQIFVHDADGLRDEPFLDLTDAVVVGSETGLLGIALHPEFAENRRLFVRYSAPSRPGTPDDYSHTFVLAEFEATADGARAKRDSERTVLEIPEPQGNHNAGSIVFGPDGYLYVGVGDGGGGGDYGTGHVDDWYDPVEGGNGQDVTENLLGSVLRIDVDGQTPEGSSGGGGGTADDTPDRKGYAIPDDNPLVGDDGPDEQYAWGFRNPWRMSFDGEDLFVADVGQSNYEEVSLVEKGGNYGWNVEEGTHCYGADDCPDRTPESVRGGEPLVDPVIEYSQSGRPVGGSSVIGGYVYRGSALPELAGAYVFGDLAASGRLFVARPSENADSTNGGSGDGNTWPIRVVDVADGNDNGSGGGDGEAGRLERVYSFGRDADGELYVLGAGGDDAGLYRITPAG